MSFLITNPISQYVINWTKQHSFLGFAGIPLYDIITTFRNGVTQDQLVMRAGSLTFNFMMALFPTIIFLFTLLPFIPVDNLDDRILDFLLLPKNANHFVNDTIHDLVRRPHGGLLSTGFFLALFFSSNGIMSMQRAFDKTGYHEAFISRKGWQKRINALGVMSVLIFLFILALIFIVGGAILVSYVGKMDYVSNFSFILLILIRWIALIILFYAVITILYRYVPSMNRRFPFWSGGAVVGTLLSLVTSYGFSYFVNNFGAYNKVYGAVGTIIVLMAWFNLNAQVLLIGYEINISIMNIRKRSELKKGVEGEERLEEMAEER